MPRGRKFATGFHPRPPQVSDRAARRRHALRSAIEALETRRQGQREGQVSQLETASHPCSGSQRELPHSTRNRQAIWGGIPLGGVRNARAAMHALCREVRLGRQSGHLHRASNGCVSAHGRRCPRRRHLSGTLNESAGGLGADVGGDVTLTAGTSSDVMQVAQNSYFPVVR
jgi:hypothetical protein